MASEHDTHDASLSEGELELGLEAAFAVEESILARLAPDGVSQQPLRLEDPTAEPDTNTQNPLPVGAARAEGRYRVLGEIARGGVGVVYRGHDVDLGRDVAMKVIRPEQGGNPEVVQRFVEEAQIGGQLQHPGIVPVYEIGLDKEGRPYFTMKLVKGRTLSALLKEGGDAERGSRALLKIFESICQTMGYAHARGVIHRDLKPSNVMTGAFGEVLVVDWGMGKVLRQGGTADEKRARHEAIDQSVIATFRSDGSGSESVVGSVMGTPRYMPPEQARGDIEAVDERSDVFSLGAILCEILTGQSPYSGPGREALVKAARAELGDAFERLEGCATDPSLVALAKQCLSPSPAARPQHAGELAEAIGAYLASLDERAREARTAAAEERAHAEQERKRRRVSVALAASVLGILVLGGGGWAWWRLDAAQRASDAEARVTGALDEVTRLHAAVAAVAADDVPAALDPVLAALRDAEALADAPDVPDEARGRLSAVRAQVAASRDEAQAHAEARAREQAMAKRLAEIRTQSAMGWEVEKSAAEYAVAFREYGLDTEAQSEAEVIAVLDASPIRETLVEHLYRWGKLEVYAQLGGRPDGSIEARQKALQAAGAGPVLRLARVIERDPWIRQLNRAQDLATLAQMAEEPGLPERTPEQVLRLIQALQGWGDAARSRRLLVRLEREHPDRVEVQMELARNWMQLPPTRVEEAVRHASAAVALEPRSPRALGLLGDAMSRAGRKESALAVRERVLEQAPESKNARFWYAQALMQMGRHAESLPILEALRSEFPDDEGIHFLEARFKARTGRAAEAVELYETLLARVPTNDVALYNYGSALLDLGRLDETLAVADRIEALAPGTGQALSLRALALSRMGRDTDARRVYEKLLPLWTEGYPAIQVRHNVALSWSRVQQPGEALRGIDEALTMLAGFERIGRWSKWMVRLLAMKGSLLWGLGRAQEGLDAADQALRLQPDDVVTLGTRASCLLSLGRLEEATAIVDELLARAPDDRRALSLGGTVRDLSGDLLGALACYEKFVEVAPERPDGWTSRSVLRLKLGDTIGAAHDAEKAVELQPRHARAHIVRANAVVNLGRLEEALASLDEAARIDASLYGVPLLRVVPLAILGRLDEAQASLARAQALLGRTGGELGKVHALGIQQNAARIETARRFHAYRAGRREIASLQEMLTYVEWHGLRNEHAACVSLLERAITEAGARPVVNTNQVTAGAIAAIQLGDEQKALPWLVSSAELARVLVEQPPSVQQTLSKHWFKQLLLDPRLGPVRDEAALARLPAERRAAWESFWKKVRDVVAK